MKNHRIRRLVGVLAVAGLVGAVVASSAVWPIKTAAESPPSAPASKPAADASGPTLHSWPMFGGTPGRNFVNLVDTGIPITWSHDARPRKEHQMVGSARLQGLRRPHRLRRQDLRRHQQQHAAQAGSQRRQGHADVLQRSRRQVPLAVVTTSCWPAASTTGNTKASASSPIVEGDRLWFVQQPLRIDLRQHRTASRPATGRDRREVQQQDRRRRHLAAGHDEVPRRISRTTWPLARR